jgi:hypothetical protein
MANKKITELPLITSVTTGDDIPIVQTGATSRVHPGAAGGLDVDLVDGIHGTAMWYSSTGTGGSDGNGGRPPTPKPTEYDASPDNKNIGTLGNAEWSGTITRTPLGGSWFHFTIDFSAQTVLMGVTAGGSEITSTNTAIKTLCWRIA